MVLLVNFGEEFKFWIMLVFQHAKHVFFLNPHYANLT